MTIVELMVVLEVAILIIVVMLGIMIYYKVFVIKEELEAMYMNQAEDHEEEMVKLRATIIRLTRIENKLCGEEKEVDIIG